MYAKRTGTARNVHNLYGMSYLVIDLGEVFTLYACTVHVFCTVERTRLVHSAWRRRGRVYAAVYVFDGDHAFVRWEASFALRKESIVRSFVRSFVCIAQRKHRSFVRSFGSFVRLEASFVRSEVSLDSLFDSSFVRSGVSFDSSFKSFKVRSFVRSFLPLLECNRSGKERSFFSLRSFVRSFCSLRSLAFRCLGSRCRLFSLPCLVLAEFVARPFGVVVRWRVLGETFAWWSRRCCCIAHNAVSGELVTCLRLLAFVVIDDVVADARRCC